MTRQKRYNIRHQLSYLEPLSNIRTEEETEHRSLCIGKKRVKQTEISLPSIKITVRNKSSLHDHKDKRFTKRSFPKTDYRKRPEVQTPRGNYLDIKSL